jgi:ribosomal protein S8
MKFTEEKLEKEFTEILEKEGFPHHLDVTKTRKTEKIKENLR